MAMKQALALMTDELVFDGWAVSRECGPVWKPGLVMVTNWRVIFLDPDTGQSAIPISGEVVVERVTPTTLMISAWHDRMTLDFDSPSALVAVKSLLKQAPGWANRGSTKSQTNDGNPASQWRGPVMDTGVTVRRAVPSAG